MVEDDKHRVLEYGEHCAGCVSSWLRQLLQQTYAEFESQATIGEVSGWVQQGLHTELSLKIPGLGGGGCIARNTGRVWNLGLQGLTSYGFLYVGSGFPICRGFGLSDERCKGFRSRRPGV